MAIESTDSSTSSSQSSRYDQRLARDLESGRMAPPPWAPALDDEYDVGYRLAIAESSHPRRNVPHSRALDRALCTGGSSSLARVQVTQFHFDANSYLEMIRAEVPRYDELQEEVARAVAGPVRLVLDLGAGTGSTSAAVLRRFPDTRVVLLDENPQMLAVATALLPSERIERTIVGDLLGALPDVAFDAVVSVLAIHHLDGQRKRLLFSRLREIVNLGGSFVMADVVIPDDPRDAVTPLSPGIDQPDRVADLLTWLREANFDPVYLSAWKDLAIIAAV